MSDDAQLKDAVRLLLACYDVALSDPKVVIPTPLHAAVAQLKLILELAK